MTCHSKIIMYGSKKNPSKKSKVSQDQVAWLMMELQAHGYNPQVIKEKEYAALQNNQRSKTESA